MRALDLFAGPGGWDEGIAELGIRPLGIEWDAAACATREARGHRTLQADIATLDPLDYAPCDLLIGSPPCQAFSTAGKGDGHLDVPLILQSADALTRGDDIRADLAPKLADPRSLLVVEPLRWALALHPTYIALEQVPPVLKLWRVFAEHLRTRGYHVWTGILNSADYGVPQTRERAILMASLTGPVQPPRATHCKGGAHTLEGELLPWVSMADALGWGMTARPSVTVAAGSGRQGGHDPLDGGSGSRQTVKGERDAGRWVLRNGNQENAAERTPDEPAPTIAFGHNAAGVRWYDRRQGAPDKNGDRQPVRLIPDTEPAPTLAADGLAKRRDRWVLADARSEDFQRGPTSTDEPAPSVGTTARQWAWEQPAPTIVSTRRSKDGGLVGRQLPPGEGENIGGRNWHRDRAGGEPQFRPDAIRVTLQDAATLQSFPPDYPWQGSRTKQFEQVGNAVPPPLARHIIAALVGAQAERRAA